MDGIKILTLRVLAAIIAACMPGEVFIRTTELLLNLRSQIVKSQTLETCLLLPPAVFTHQRHKSDRSQVVFLKRSVGFFDQLEELLVGGVRSNRQHKPAADR